MRRSLLFLCLLAMTSPAAPAQAPAAPPATVPVLMLSDIHFDPFRSVTAANLQQLVLDAPEIWDKTLGKTMSSAEQAAAAAGVAGCDGKNQDTDYTLLTSSLSAEQGDVVAPAFITVSGDLITHNFDCKYYSLVQNPSATGLRDFAAKTAAYVALKLNATFPKSPVYLALGNNDSGCRDYKENEGVAKAADPFLEMVAKTFATVALDSNNAKSILATFGTRGDYSVLLPKPFADTKLIVLQDLFEFGHYRGPCSGAFPVDAIAAQIAWLKTQLADPKAKHFWMMTHIAPGVDPYNTIHNNSGYPGDVTLGVNDFADTLRKSTSDIELVLYGHTHMDEMRLTTDSSGKGKVPGRVNPSITSWTRHYPSFTVADVDPAKALLVNFTVYRSSDMAGKGNWKNKYTYFDSYGLSDYSAASLATLSSTFRTNPTGTSAANYQAHYQNSVARTNWKAYVCAVVSDTPDEYSACYTGKTPAASH